MKLTIKPPLRGYDSQGSGAFGAPRGNRTHKGIDLACMKGSKVLSVCDGEVTKLGYPYNQGEPKEDWHQWKKDKFLKQKELRYVQITDKDDNDVRYFYVKPMVVLGSKVKAGRTIGEVHGLTNIYDGITDHFHFEILKDGEIINPHDYLESL